MLIFFKIGVTCFADMSYIIYIHTRSAKRYRDTYTERSNHTTVFSVDSTYRKTHVPYIIPCS